MMNCTIELLMKGDNSVIERYRDAREHWKEILTEVDPSNPRAVGDVAGIAQSWFEINCGGAGLERIIGQEVMVISGIYQYYTTVRGFDKNMDKAKAMYRGLLGSSCSSEIKVMANQIAELHEELKET